MARNFTKFSNELGKYFEEIDNSEMELSKKATLLCNLSGKMISMNIARLKYGAYNGISVHTPQLNDEHDVVIKKEK